MTHAGHGAKRVVLDEPLEKLVHSHSAEVLRAVAASEDLDEELALTMLARRDLPQGVIDALVKNVVVMKDRKVINTIVAHPRTPRHISVPIARRLYTFELMQIALTPAVPADVKRAVEDVLVARLETISAGERMTLARRASTNVAAALLFDPEPRIIEVALESPFITEAHVVKALLHHDCPQTLVHLVCRDDKWSLRRDVRIALLRNEYTPMSRVLVYARALPTNLLRDLLKYAVLTAEVRIELTAELDERTKKNQASKEGESGGKN